ncbi:hypothetical protein KKC67_03255 [Patescibacteria group bacterium]|nr:hypothetical protein [Patescibacteria group bacterium]
MFKEFFKFSTETEQLGRQKSSEENKNKLIELINSEDFEIDIAKLVDIYKPGNLIHGIKKVDPQILESLFENGLLTSKDVEKKEKERDIKFSHQRFSGHENPHRDKVSFSVVQFKPGTRASMHFTEKENYKSGGHEPEGAGLVLNPDFVKSNIKRFSSDPDFSKFRDGLGDEITCKGSLPISEIQAIISPRKFQELMA